MFWKGKTRPPHTSYCCENSTVTSGLIGRDSLPPSLSKAPSIAGQNSLGERGWFFFFLAMCLGLFVRLTSRRKACTAPEPLWAACQSNQELNKQPREKQSYHSSFISDPSGRRVRWSSPSSWLQGFSIPQQSDQPFTHRHTRYLVVAIHASIQEDMDYSFMTIPSCQVQGSVFLSVAA